MGYSLDSLADGCYENSTVLINKFDIRDGEVLDSLEQSITSALIATIRATTGDIFMLKDILKELIT